MGLFDNLQNQAKSIPRKPGEKREQFIFTSIPAALDEFTSLPQAAMSTPFETAAMTVIALCAYPYNQELSVQMLNFLRGPRPLNGAEIGFINDRFRSADYVPRSYFDGAAPQNDYTPQEPYTITVFDGPYSYQNAGYAKLFIRSGGADSPREVVLRQAKDSKWYLWDQFLLVGVRQPESANPWA